MAKNKHILVAYGKIMMRYIPIQLGLTKTLELANMYQKCFRLGSFIAMINLSDSLIFNVDENIKTLLGFTDCSTSLREIIERTHSYDISFVIEVEKT